MLAVYLLAPHLSELFWLWLVITASVLTFGVVRLTIWVGAALVMVLARRREERQQVERAAWMAAHRSRENWR